MTAKSCPRGTKKVGGRCVPRLEKLKIAWNKDTSDWGHYAIYHNPIYPNTKIHLARIKAHESYGYKYGVWESGFPCATFIGGANNLKEAIKIAEKK